MIYKRTEETERILKEVYQCIDDNGGIAKKEQLAALGIDYRRILDFVENDEVIRIKNGYYTYGIERFSEEALVSKLFPDGVLCMESALYAYGYISRKPVGFHVAIDKNTSKSRFKLDYPKVIPYYTEPEVLTIGVTTISYEGCDFQIYDKDRLICDCLKYESKMNREDFKEAVQAYIKDEDKDISALMEYARERKVVKRVQSLIGVWL
ncbi:MAG: type IV toxin-antitoxin system AbiEi family antitoxin domain-containing protein [Agathobacter sp.]|nr:type IV toxin-antitoxin system AbiEi family antitoxin domain-containing protein [Agathobacter sp.]